MGKVKDHFLGEEEFNEAMEDICASQDHDIAMLKLRIKELEEENALLLERIAVYNDNYTNGRV